MKTVTTSKGTFMFVIVPHDAINISNPYIEDLTFDYNKGSKGALIKLPFSPKGYEIIGQISTITEDQAGSIIETIVYGKFRNYLISTQYEEYLLPLPSLSLKTLIKSEGLDPEKDYVILKINK